MLAHPTHLGGSIPDRTGITIRAMNSADLGFAASCTAGEGWVSEGQSTLEGFFLKNPPGCLLAEENNQPVGICIATPYTKSAFIGELIVRPDARGKGVGALLLNHAVSLLKARGAGTIYLDGVLKAVPLYERNGFHKVCRSWRFSGALPGTASTQVRKMEFNDLAQVFDLDLQFFGEDRSFYLMRRFEQFPELSKVMVERQCITGYILGRGGEGWLSAGPWVVNSQGGSPLDLVNSLACEARGRPISIGVLEANPQACELVRSLGFQSNPDSPWRMALGPSRDLGTSPQCLAVGSAAKG